MGMTELTREQIIELIDRLKPLELAGYSLSKKDLSRLNLQGANLSKADLRDTNLVGAKMPDGAIHSP